MRRILLINPHETEQIGYTNPPLGILYIAGTLLKHGFGVRVVDGCLEGKDAIRRALYEYRPDLVGITCLTPGRKKALEIAAMAKNADPRTVVAMGGAHATIMHRQLLRHYPSLDCAVLGEGEISFLELAQGRDWSSIRGIAYRAPSGEVFVNPRRENVQDLDTLPFPAWHLVDLKRYSARNDSNFKIVNGVNLGKEPRISVVFSRGCTGHCNFCSTWWIWKGWRHRSPGNMVDEMELLHDRFGIRHFCFADDAMTIDREATIGLCDEIIGRGLRIAFNCTTRSDCVDETVLRKLKAAGCYSIAFGIETASPTLLKKMKKENHVETSRRAIEMANRVGLFTLALLIIGSVGETDDTIRETVRFIKATRPKGIGIAGSLWIFPGTKLYQDCKRAGFIDDDFWLTDEPFKIYTMEHGPRKLRIYSLRILWHGIGPGRLLADKIRNIVKSLQAGTARRLMGGA